MFAIPQQSRRLILVRRPEGIPDSSCFEVEMAPIEPPGDGEVLTEISHISVDPAMRGWITDMPSYIPPVAIGETMRAFTVGRVVESNDPALPIGTLVTGQQGAQRYAVSRGSDLRKLPEGSSPEAALGIVGITGLTAFFGFFDVGKPIAGDIVVVTGAGGAVGSTVVQLAKLAGCTVIALADSAEKCAWLLELGADAAFDQNDADWRKQMRDACAAGIDILFDGVGGAALDSLLWQVNERARVVLCGAISQYNSAKATGPAGYLALITKRATMQGFLLQDYHDRIDTAEARLIRWVQNGKLKQRLTRYSGLDQLPLAIAGMFEGRNLGKTIVDLT